jgi:hypothetical protein
MSIAFYIGAAVPALDARMIPTAMEKKMVRKQMPTANFKIVTKQSISTTI